MKRIFALFLLLFLLLPISAPALTTETQILGSWAGERESDGKTTYFAFRFYNDGTVLKESYSFKRKDYFDDEPYIFASIGTWDRIGGVINVHTESLTGGDFVTQLFLTDDKCLALPLTTCYIVLTKLPEPIKRSNISLVDSWE